MYSSWNVKYIRYMKIDLNAVVKGSVQRKLKEVEKDCNDGYFVPVLV